MIGKQPTLSQAEKSRKARAEEESAQAKISKDQRAVAQMLSDKSMEKRIELAKEMFPSKAPDIAIAIEKGNDLDTVLDFDQIERVQEELEATGVFRQSMEVGTAKYSEMSDKLKARYSDVFFDGGVKMEPAVLRNLQNDAFMKFMFGLSMGPDLLNKKFLEFVFDPPEDAKKIRKFLRDYADVARTMGEPSLEKAQKFLDKLRETGEDLAGEYRDHVMLYLANDEDFPGAKPSRFHFRKELGNEALEKAVSGLIRRGDKEGYDSLVQMLNDPNSKKAVKGHLGKDWKIESWKSKEVEEDVPAPEPEIEIEPEEPRIVRKGKTFRRSGPAEMSETMTPADAILRSSAVNPDLDKALRLVKGIA